MKPQTLYAIHMKIATLLLLVFFLSCDSGTSPESNPFKMIVTDTMKLMPYNELDLSRTRSSEFNLPDITKGVDSFEVRIWVSSGLSPDYFAILRYSRNGWVAHKGAYHESGEKLDSLTVWNINIGDSIGNLISFLSDTNVVNLPSQHAIPNFKDSVADGQSCTIEIATKQFYKALHYHCPEHYLDSYNRRFMGIVDYLNNYFSIYNPWCLPRQLTAYNIGFIQAYIMNKKSYLR